MKKEFEDLLIEFDEMVFEPTTLCENPQAQVENFRNRLKQALNELKAIKEAKPSEAMECLEELRSNLGVIYDDTLNTIEQALLKAQELEKELEIIWKKQVDIMWFCQCVEANKTFEDYNSAMGREIEYLTEEEFNTLKRRCKR